MNWVSWLSPIARALLNARLGQTVRCHSPAGEATLEILAIAFNEAGPPGLSFADGKPSLTA